MNMQYVWVTLIAFFFKLVTFIYYCKTMLEIETLLKMPILYKYPVKYDFVMRNINWIKIFTILYMIMIMLHVSFLLFGEPNISTNGKRRLPCEVHVKCSLDNDICYMGFYVFTIINFYVSGILNATMDCMFCKLTTICSCLFDVLHANLECADYADNESAEEILKENVFRHINILM